jgi:hypothetical protein
MTDPIPLFIIMGTLVGLVVIQRLLIKVESRPKENLAGTRAGTAPPSPSSPHSSPPKTRGLPLFPGLSAIGLDERGVEQLKNLISKGDSTALTAFLASHRPGILELDEYLKQLRATFNDALPNIGIKISTENIRATLETFEPPKPPAGIHFELLNPSEYESSLVFNPNSQRLVTRDLMAQLGGQKFSKYFEYYCSRNKSIAFSVSPHNPDRPTMEALAESGIANKGRQIPLATRLTVLKMNQLRQMCKDLNHDTKYTRKQDATEGLAQVPGAAVLLSMSYVVDDLFALNPIKDETYDIKREWNYLSAYAKLLISRMNTKTSPVSN